MDRKTYIEKLTAQLKEWDDEIIKLEAKVKDLSSAAKTEYEKQISDIKEKRSTVSEKLSELKDTGSEAWEEFRDGLEMAVQDIKKAVQNALQKFKAAKQEQEAEENQSVETNDPDDQETKNP